MDLEDFIKQQKSLIEEFYSHWINSRKTEPDNYPMAMDAADWEEQFAAFQGFAPPVDF